MHIQSRAFQALAIGAAVTFSWACGGIPIQINGQTKIIGGSKKKSEPAATAAGAAKGRPGTQVTKKSDVITKRASAAFTVPSDNLDPLYKVDVKVEGTVLRMNEHGFKDCSRAWGVGNPIAKLVVQDDQVLALRFKENTPRSKPTYAGIMLMMPNNSYQCKSGEGITRRFTAGEYYVYSVWTGAKTNNHKHPGEQFASTGSLEVRTMGRKEAAPVFTLNKSVHNPWYSQQFAYSGSYNKPKAMGYKSCSSYHSITAGHIAEIKVTEEIETVFSILGAKEVILANDQDKYWCDVRLSSRRKWLPGNYKVYSYVDRDTAKNMAVSTFKAHHFDVKSAPTMLGEVPTYTVDELAEPKVIRGKTLGNRYTYARDCGGKKQYFSTQPDFYIELDKPLGKLNIRLLDSGKNEMGISVKDVTKNKELLYRKERRCSGGGYITGGEMSGYKLRKADGTYAVFVAQKGPDAKDYTFILNTGKTTIDPFFKTRDISAGLDLEGRVMKRHYPFMNRMSVGGKDTTRIGAWMKIDTKLIGYTTKGSDFEKPRGNSGKGYLGKNAPLKLAAGEPVIILGVKERRKSGKPYKFRILTADLHVVVVDADTLSTDAPGALNLPNKPRNYKAFSTAAMTPHTDKKAGTVQAKYTKVNDKYNTCFDKYWDKHGGSEASHYDRVTRRNGKIVKVKNMGDIIAKRANKKCGLKKVEKLRAKRDKQLLRSFQGKRASVLKDVRTRIAP